MKAWQLIVTILILVGSSSAQLLLGKRDSPVAQYGPYDVTNLVYDLPGVLGDTNTKAVMVYPEKMLQEGNTAKFPLLVFAHGFAAGNIATFFFHRALLEGVASFGFIVVAPRSCAYGCPGRGLWDTYYQEQLKVIEWASIENRTEDTAGLLKFVDRNAGFGVFGHSMGGQATARSLTFADAYDIRAGVLLHPAPTENLIITAPVAAFTGTRDGCCGEDATRAIYDDATGPKAYANMLGARHTEPNLGSTDWSAYVAAWFKIYLVNSNDATADEDEATFYNSLIYGSDPDSLCGDSIPMTDNCETLAAL